MPRRECDQLLAPTEEKRLGGNENRTCPLLDESFEGDVKVALAAGLYHENLFSHSAGGRPQLSYFDVDPWDPWVICVCQHAAGATANIQHPGAVRYTCRIEHRPHRLTCHRAKGPIVTTDVGVPALKLECGELLRLTRLLYRPGYNSIGTASYLCVNR